MAKKDRQQEVREQAEMRNTAQRPFDTSRMDLTAADVVREAHRRNEENANAAFPLNPNPETSDTTGGLPTERVLREASEANAHSVAVGGASDGPAPLIRDGAPAVIDSATTAPESRKAEMIGSLLADLLAVLSKHCGERGTSEGAVETLERLLRERDEALRERDEYKAQLQPVHDAFGPHANARGLLVSHVKDSSPEYDVGGKYRLALIAVENGAFRISEVADVIAGEVSVALPFGHVRDHLEKHVDSFVTPKAHRS